MSGWEAMAKELKRQKEEEEASAKKTQHVKSVVLAPFQINIAKYIS